jgi:uncharacterized protein YjcR
LAACIEIARNDFTQENRGKKSSRIVEDHGQSVADGDGWIRSYPWELQALIGAGSARYNAATFRDAIHS